MNLPLIRLTLAIFLLVVTSGLAGQSSTGFPLLRPVQAVADSSSPPSDKLMAATLRAYYLYAFGECSFEPVDDWLDSFAIELGIQAFTHEELAEVEPDVEPEDMFARAIEIRGSRERVCLFIRAKFGVEWATPREES